MFHHLPKVLKLLHYYIIDYKQNKFGFKLKVTFVSFLIV